MASAEQQARDLLERMEIEGIGALSPGAVTAKLCTMSWNTRNLWTTFGSCRVEYTPSIPLPAYLLDDGL